MLDCKSENANDKESCVTTVGGTNNEFTVENAERLREMYEATLLAHITLVGQIEEYESGAVVESSVEAYRRGILANEEYESSLDRWQLVRDVTFERFRNGTMDVYIPVDNDVDPTEYTTICVLDTTNDARTVVVRHPSFTREYRKTACILGTVFQDQAYFLVRRDRLGHPDLLARPLTVFLACGYDRTSPPLDQTEARYQFEPLFRNPEIYPVPLYSNQDVARFSVPPLSDPFDSNREGVSGRFGKVRCSIVGAVYGVNPPLQPGGGLPDFGDANTPLVDRDMLTATVTVSEHQSGQTLHGRMNNMLHLTSDERIAKMEASVYYTYFLGWYTGFIRMPYFSLQDMLSALPYTVPGKDEETAALSANESVLRAVSNNERLRRYRSLALLFADEGEDRFATEHFGFLTPDEAMAMYRNNYNDRFDAYFGRSLGVFLQSLLPEYRRQ